MILKIKHTISMAGKKREIKEKFGLRSIKIEALPSGMEYEDVLNELQNSLYHLEELLGNNLEWFNDTSLVLASAKDTSSLGMYEHESKTVFLYSPDFTPLAHEFFHAMDNQLAAVIGASQKSMMTRLVYAMMTMPEYTEKAEKCVKALTGADGATVRRAFKGMFERSLYTDVRKQHYAYWTRPDEMIARAFETYGRILFPHDKMLSSDIDGRKDFYPTDVEMRTLIPIIEEFINASEKILDSGEVSYLDLGEEELEKIEKQARFVGHYDYIKKFYVEREIREISHREEERF